METIIQDLRYSARMLLKNPGFTLVAVLTLALGIGANAAIFSVANAVLFRPLPFKDQDRLVRLREVSPKHEFAQEGAPVTPPNFLYWRDNNRSFEHIAAMKGQTINLTNFGEPERVTGMAVTANFFSMLGVAPARGRTFLPEDERERSDQVALISYGLWQRRLGADPEAIGKEIKLNDRTFILIGVLPEDFQLTFTRAEVWLPLPFTASDAENRGAHMLTVIGRLKPDIAIDRALSDINSLMGNLAQQYPQSNEGWTASMNLLQEDGTAPARPALLILLGAVGLLLLIACANVANLLLARAAGRSKEFAVRVALGAGRFRLARQLFTESLLLTILGGTAGLLLAMWCIDFFVAVGPRDIPRLQEARLDGRVVGFTFALAVLTAFLSGLAPVMKSIKIDLNESLKEGGRGIAKGFWQLRLIMVAETSLSLVLLIGAGLLIKSYSRLLNVDPGIRTENILTMNVSLPFSQYPEDHRRGAFFNDLLARVEALPGVRSAAITQNLPLTRSSLFYYLDIEGVPAPAAGEPHLQGEAHSISSDYFRALGIPLIQGRAFTEQDNESAPQTIIISESMARRYFSNSNPIGKKITILANRQPPREIVGVVGDVKHKGLDKEVVDEMYLPYMQSPPFTGTLVTHTEVEPPSLVASIKEQVWAIAPDLPVFRVSTMEELLAATVAEQRFNTLLLGVFAVLALLLASIGIYGVVSYSVSQSTQEIGIRMALGAQSRDILKLVVGQAMMLILAGVAIGVPGAFVLTGLMQSLLFEVGSRDPATFVLVSSLLMAVALAACCIPARRAMKVDPMVALRYE